jgi:hypothetical protein
MAAWSCSLMILTSASCSHDYQTARTLLRRASPLPHTLRTAAGPEVLLPLTPLTPLDRATRDEEIAILTLRGLLQSP